MNQYTELLYYIKQLGDADKYVNTVTNDSEDEIDQDKANIYPLLNVFIEGAGFTNGQTVTFNVELTCLNIRELNKKINTDKYFGNDNRVDNHNETLAVLNSMWTKMYKDFDANDITSSENPAAVPIRHRTNTNDAEGWSLSFEIEMPNTTLNLCQ